MNDGERREGAPTPLAAPEGLSHVFHPERRAVLVRAEGPVRGDTWVRFVLDLARRHPEAAGHARVYDLLAYTGSVGQEDATRLNAALLAELGAVPREAVVVTTDAAFRLWALALEATLVPPPRIAVVADPGAAWDALEALRAQGG